MMKYFLRVFNYKNMLLVVWLIFNSCGKYWNKLNSIGIKLIFSFDYLEGIIL